MVTYHLDQATKTSYTSNTTSPHYSSTSATTITTALNATIFIVTAGLRGVNIVVFSRAIVFNLTAIDTKIAVRDETTNFRSSHVLKRSL